MLRVSELGAPVVKVMKLARVPCLEKSPSDFKATTSASDFPLKVLRSDPSVAVASSYQLIQICFKVPNRRISSSSRPRQSDSFWKIAMNSDMTSVTDGSCLLG